MTTTQETQAITTTLSKKDGVHEQWIADYRTPDNEQFFESAFDRIAQLIGGIDGASILDAGCGSGRQSERLARRNFKVTAVDFSDSILAQAGKYLRERNCEDNVTLRREDLLDMSFPNQTFEHVLCWGVLMHIFDVEGAVFEISRVIQPGGKFVVSEGNMHSVQARTLELLRRLFRKGDAVKKSSEAGIEYWTETDSGKLLTREANVRGLTKIIERNGFKLKHRIAGQLTEAYTRFSARPIRKTIHAANRLWFQHVGYAPPAFGNILVFERL